ncbi:MAG: cation diffusion facilitator family transporter [Candidatus Sumerlaeia bacterium]
MSEHSHNHDHSHHGHSHDHTQPYKHVAMRRLGLSLTITFVVMLVEVIGGWLSGSIALISDAGHMLTHAFAIGISMAGIMIARKPRCHHRTYGLLRAEVLAAFVNGIFLLTVTAWIVYESIERFIHPEPILTGQMLAIALLGLLVNLLSIWILEGSQSGDLNIHSVFLHMIGDAASSVAIVIVAVVIRYSGWGWLDPAVSILIAMLILIWAYGLLRESARVLLEMAPRGRNVKEICVEMLRHFPEIKKTDNEHVWMITQDVIVFTAHIYLKKEKGPADLMEWQVRVEDWLKENFDVHEATIQVHR